ncbi:hypothetical protein CV014_11265 [Nostoc sp. CMAA1605]|nr:hypothetical protein [Nostoc sp. CMAA1605]
MNKRSLLPQPYLKANQYHTRNPHYNEWAFLQHERLYVFRELPADNPFGIGVRVLYQFAAISRKEVQENWDRRLKKLASPVFWRQTIRVKLFSVPY